MNLAAQLLGLSRHCAVVSFQSGCTHRYKPKRIVKGTLLISWQICFYHLGLHDYKIHVCPLLLKQWYVLELWKSNCYKHLKETWEGVIERNPILVTWRLFYKISTKPFVYLCWGLEFPFSFFIVEHLFILLLLIWNESSGAYAQG